METAAELEKDEEFQRLVAENKRLEALVAEGPGALYVRVLDEVLAELAEHGRTCVCIVEHLRK